MKKIGKLSLVLLVGLALTGCSQKPKQIQHQRKMQLLKLLKIIKSLQEWGIYLLRT